MLFDRWELALDDTLEHARARRLDVARPADLRGGRTARRFGEPCSIGIRAPASPC